MSILHIESFQNSGDEGHLCEIDACTIFPIVNFEAKDLMCRAKIGEVQCCKEPRHNIDHSCRIIFSVHYQIMSAEKHITIPSMCR